MKSKDISFVKLIIFLLSILLFCSYVLDKGNINSIFSIIFIYLCVQLLLLLRQRNEKIITMVYLISSIFSLLFTFMSTSIEYKSDIGPILINCILGLLQIIWGCILLQHAKGYTVLMATILVIINAASGHTEMWEFYILFTAAAALWTRINNEKKLLIAEKSIIAVGFILLTIYNIYFGIVLFLELVYTTLNKINRKGSYFIYPMELSFLLYELLIKKEDTVDTIWNNIWNSFADIFCIYPVYTVVIFTLGITIYRNYIQIENPHALHLLLAMGIIYCFSGTGTSNTITVFLLILAMLLTVTPPVNISVPVWCDYLLLSYGITISSLYWMEYVK